MRHALALGCLLLCARAAFADAIDRDVVGLHSESSKVRVAAVLALSKTVDPRGIIGLADTVEKDADPTIRRLAVLALDKMVSASTPEDARELALDAIESAATHDDDGAVRRNAARVLERIGHLRRRHHPRADTPEVFVQVEAATDLTRRAPTGTSDRLHAVVERGVAKTGYATSWPGGPPTAAELATSRARAFIVASSVKAVDIRRVGRQMQIACTVGIRIAPWSGRDGGEKWEANKAASASGSARATTGPSDRDVAAGVRDCVEAVAEDLTSRQIVPFLRRLVVAAN